jgi:hypothetical protein
MYDLDMLFIDSNHDIECPVCKRYRERVWNLGTHCLAWGILRDIVHLHGIARFLEQSASA